MGTFWLWWKNNSQQIQLQNSWFLCHFRCQRRGGCPEHHSVSHVDDRTSVHRWWAWRVPRPRGRDVRVTLQRSRSYWLRKSCRKELIPVFTRRHRQRRRWGGRGLQWEVVCQNTLIIIFIVDKDCSFIVLIKVITLILFCSKCERIY